MSDVSRETEDEQARQEMRAALIKALVPLAVQLGVVLAITKRDDITRMGMRIRYLIQHQRRRELEDCEVARFRRDFTVWEHEQMGR